MNLMPKANLWATKAVQMMIIRGTAGSSSSSRGGGEYESYGWHTEENLQNKTTNTQKTTATNKDGIASKENAPSDNSKSWTGSLHESPILEVPTCDPLYMVAEKEAAKNAKQPKGAANQEIINNLKSYFDDQIIYYKTMANYNKAAVKRIKKIKRKWNKIVE